jgi:hypothetical protein
MKISILLRNNAVMNVKADAYKAESDWLMICAEDGRYYYFSRENVLSFVIDDYESERKD